MEIQKSAVGKRFRDVRKKFGLTQAEFARKLGCGRSNVSLIEIGKNLPGPGILTGLMSKYNISLNWLFSGIGSMLIENENENGIPDFQEYTGEIKEMLNAMKDSRQIMHRVLSDYFTYVGVLFPSVKEKKKKIKKAGF